MVNTYIVPDKTCRSLKVLLICLLFFIERDELDIYNIPITKITNDFLDYIHQQESVNIELSSEFILFISTLMRIKAKMLLPRKELDAQGNEIDPRQELINKILEYKRFKEASAQMAEMEALRMLMVKTGKYSKRTIADRRGSRRRNGNTEHYPVQTDEGL